MSMIFDVLSAAPLHLDSPLNYQVFQRSSRAIGAIRISGHYSDVASAVEVQITGDSLEGPLPGSWQTIPVDADSHTFYADLPVAAGGWYEVSVRSKPGDRIVSTVTVEKVGVGEVFVGAGQSNSTNSGQFKTWQTSGMVSAFSGADWRIADDPQPGTHDDSTGGSFFPAFGDAMYARFRVPIGVAVTGHGGTSVNQWQPGDELFEWTRTRLLELGPKGFRALLWHQGESDTPMPTEEYAAKLTTIIRASQQRAGWAFPWFVARVSYHNPTETSVPTMRAAHKKLWDLGIAMEGPDTDTLVGDNRDQDGLGIHFSPKGLKAHGEMWADLVGNYLERLFKAEAA